MNDGLNFPPNFEKLVLGCIDADYFQYILVGILGEIYKMYILLHRSDRQENDFFRELVLFAEAAVYLPLCHSELCRRYKLIQEETLVVVSIHGDCA